MTDYTPNIERLRQFHAEGRIIRKQWRDVDKDGRERACALAALWAPCGERASASPCPADAERAK